MRHIDSHATAALKIYYDVVEKLCLEIEPGYIDERGGSS